MSSLPPSSVEDRLHALRRRWDRYVEDGRFEQFIEFAVAINSLAEHFSRIRLPGLVRLCEGLENAALARLGDQSSHPLPQQDIASLQRQLDTLLGSVNTSRTPVPACRAKPDAPARKEIDWVKPRSVWIVADPMDESSVKA